MCLKGPKTKTKNVSSSKKYDADISLKILNPGSLKAIIFFAQNFGFRIVRHHFRSCAVSIFQLLFFGCPINEMVDLSDSKPKTCYFFATTSNFVSLRGYEAV